MMMFLLLVFLRDSEFWTKRRVGVCENIFLLKDKHTRWEQLPPLAVVCAAINSSCERHFKHLTHRGLNEVSSLPWCLQKRESLLQPHPNRERKRSGEKKKSNFWKGKNKKSAGIFFFFTDSKKMTKKTRVGTPRGIKDTEWMLKNNAWMSVYSSV